MRYIIMCGGQYPKWETPRQLTHICGEPVVARTIRMLREAGVEDIAISASDSRFEAFDVPVLKHPNGFVAIKDGGGSWVDAFWPTEDPVCYLMGDVVFSPYAIRRIVETQTDSIQFFASSYPFSGSYIKQHAEPFAFKIVDQTFPRGDRFCPPERTDRDIHTQTDSVGTVAGNQPRGCEDDQF